MGFRLEHDLRLDPSPFIVILNLMTIRQTKSSEHAGTRERIIACRRRLRRARRVQRAFRLSQDEAVLAATELLRLDSDEVEFADPDEVFEEAGTPHARATRHFTPEVDRRTRLRAR